jgi:hypothetical protein
VVGIEEETQVGIGEEYDKYGYSAVVATIIITPFRS